jgi:hypothetical protein
MMPKKSPKSPKIFVCKKCDYNCCKQSDWNKHVLTAKHIKDDAELQKNRQNRQNFACSCGNEYKYRQGLYNHKKKCTFKEEATNENDNISDKNLILTLIHQNNELQKQMLEVIKNGTNINNTINSHNKTFNLQLFLNETCKDAMNIMDFVDSIKIQLADMESIGELGFVNGMSKLIIKNLKALDENMRPVHCSDPKRDTMYVKDSNVWEKEDSENMKIKKAIKYIAHKNICALPQWRDKYPDCVYSDSKKSDQYNHIVLESLGGSGDNDEEKASKIVKKIAKEVVIDKNSE